METRRPQLDLDDLRQLGWLLGGLLSVLAIWTVLYVELDTWTLLIPATAAVVAAILWPRLPALIPGVLHTLAFPIIVVVFVVDLWFNGQLLPAMIRLDVLLIVYRCISYRTRREDLQLIVLGLFLIVVAGVVTVSLGFALQIIAFVGCSLAFLLVITLVDAAEARHPAPRTPLFTWSSRMATPAWTEKADWTRLAVRVRRATDWRLIALGTLAFGGVVIFSGLLFLAIPRFELGGSFFLDKYITRKARTGFSESIRFGEVTDIITDNSRALSVEITDRNGDPAVEQAPAIPYLRMLVMDEYRDGTFRMSSALRRQIARDEGNRSWLDGSLHETGGPTVLWTFYFEPGISRFLPIPGPYMDLRFSSFQDVSSARYLSMIALRNEPIAMVAYRVRNPSTGWRIEDREFQQRIDLLGIPEGGELPVTANTQLALPGLTAAEHETLGRALEEITGGLSREEIRRLAPDEFATMVSRWLADRHTYSLQSALPGGSGDPVVRWIAGTSPGHCELFAGAFMALAREAGFPTHAVAGFMGGTWNAFTGNLTVRNDNAHAWCEIWDQENGSWLRVDPTPGSTDETTLGTVLTKQYDNSWSARLESLRILWYRRVVNFDGNAQRDVVRGVREATQAASLRLRAAVERFIAGIKSWFVSPWNARRTAGALTIAAAAALLAWGWSAWRHGLRWRWGGGGHGRPDPVRAEACEWLERIAACGLRPGDSRSSDESRETLAALLRLRYAAPASWPLPERVFREARALWRSAKRGRKAKA